MMFLYSLLLTSFLLIQSSEAHSKLVSPEDRTTQEGSGTYMNASISNLQTIITIII